MTTAVDFGRHVPTPTTIAALIDRALAAYDDLTALGEEIEDEWTYVNDLSAAWRDAPRGRRRRDRADAPRRCHRRRRVDRAIDEIAPISDPHRAIDWLSTFPQVVLARPRRDAVRFQDAAQDGRAVVYAGIQADPLVARAAELLADATTAATGAGARGDERRDHRPGGWRTMFPTLFGRRRAGPRARPVRGDPGRRLAVADRGEQVRSQFRGAIVEALTARLLARRVGAGAGPSRAARSCSTACGPRSIRTT